MPKSRILVIDDEEEFRQIMALTLQRKGFETSEAANGQRGAHVHTFSRGLRADAVAWGTVRLNGQAIELAQTSDATLEQVRYFCQVIQHPHGGFDVDC
jgi:CheY-like chemotaxis protein